MQTIYILWLRQLKRYVRSRSRIVGSLGQPILFLLALGYGFGSVYKQAGQGDYLTFLAPGVIGMSIIFTAIFTGMEIIWDRQFGFLKETMVAPVSRFHIMLGRTLGGATVSALQGLIVLVIALIAGFRPAHLAGIVPLIGLMFLVGLLFASLGTLIASRLEDMQGFHLIINFLVMPLFFLSGALFPLAGLPKALAIAALIDPLSYGIDSFRHVLIGMSHYSLGVDVLVLSCITLFFLVLGGWSFSKIEV